MPAWFNRSVTYLETNDHTFVYACNVFNDDLNALVQHFQSILLRFEIRHHYLRITVIGLSRHRKEARTRIFAASSAVRWLCSLIHRNALSLARLYLVRYWNVMCRWCVGYNLRQGFVNPERKVFAQSDCARC